jgi:hypothetical protein
MELNITIEDETIARYVRDAIIKEIQARATRIAEETVREQGVLIDDAVQRYMERTMSTDKLKILIDKSIIDVLKDKIENL